MACRYFKIKESELSGLEGKVAIVTGASSGIGLATAKLLVRLNAGAVFLLDLQGPKEDLGPRASFIETNVTSWESLRGAFDIVMARCGRIDIVHANAGIADTTDYVNLSEENGQLLEPSRYPYDVNLFGCFNTVSLAIHHMQKQSPQGGSIIMTASGAGYEGVTSAAYSELNYSCFLNCGLFTEELIIEAAGKHGIIGFLRAMKLQLYPKLPIRLNVVAPGFTESAITASALSTFKAVGLIIQPASAIALAVGKLATDTTYHGQALFVARNECAEFEGPVLEATAQCVGSSNGSPEQFKRLIETMKADRIRKQEAQHRL